MAITTVTLPAQRKLQKQLLEATAQATAITSELTLPLSRFRKECSYATFHGMLCTVGVFALQLLYLIIRIAYTQPLSAFDMQICYFFGFLTLSTTFMVKWFLYDSINAEGQYLLLQVMHKEMMYYNNATPHEYFDDENNQLEQDDDANSMITLASTNQGSVQQAHNGNCTASINGPSPQISLMKRYATASYKLYKTTLLHYITVCIIFVILLITVVLVLPDVAIPYFFCSNFIAIIFCSVVFTFLWKRKSFDYYSSLYQQQVAAHGTSMV